MGKSLRSLGQCINLMKHFISSFLLFVNLSLIRFASGCWCTAWHEKSKYHLTAWKYNYLIWLQLNFRKLMWTKLFSNRFSFVTRKGRTTLCEQPTTYIQIVYTSMSNCCEWDLLWALTCAMDLYVEKTLTIFYFLHEFTKWQKHPKTIAFDIWVIHS